MSPPQIVSLTGLIPIPDKPVSCPETPSQPTLFFRLPTTVQRGAYVDEASFLKEVGSQIALQQSQDPVSSFRLAGEPFCRDAQGNINYTIFKMPPIQSFVDLPSCDDLSCGKDGIICEVLRDDDGNLAAQDSIVPTATVDRQIAQHIAAYATEEDRQVFHIPQTHLCERGGDVFIRLEQDPRKRAEGIMEKKRGLRVVEEAHAKTAEAAKNALSWTSILEKFFVATPAVYIGVHGSLATYFGYAVTIMGAYYGARVAYRDSYNNTYQEMYNAHQCTGEPPKERKIPRPGLRDDALNILKTLVGSDGLGLISGPLLRGMAALDRRGKLLLAAGLGAAAAVVIEIVRSGKETELNPEIRARIEAENKAFERRLEEAGDDHEQLSELEMEVERKNARLRDEIAGFNEQVRKGEGSLTLRSLDFLSNAALGLSAALALVSVFAIAVPKAQKQTPRMIERFDEWRRRRNPTHTPIAEKIEKERQRGKNGARQDFESDIRSGAIECTKAPKPVAVPEPERAPHPSGDALSRLALAKLAIVLKLIEQAEGLKAHRVKTQLAIRWANRAQEMIAEGNPIEAMKAIDRAYKKAMEALDDRYAQDIQFTTTGREIAIRGAAVSFGIAAVASAIAGGWIFLAGGAKVGMASGPAILLAF